MEQCIMCIPDLGWEQAGGESVTEVDGRVYRLLARRSACAWPGPATAFVCRGCEDRHMAAATGI